MFDKTNVVSHAQASAVNPDGPKYTANSGTQITDQRSRESTSKSSVTKRKDEAFMEWCLGEIRESSRTLMESLRANDKMKMNILMSMQQIMQKLVNRF